MSGWVSSTQNIYSQAAAWVAESLVRAVTSTPRRGKSSRLPAMETSSPTFRLTR